MRIIIHGVGAIGGVVGAALVEAGHEVLGIARGRMLEAIRAHGLTMISPKGRVMVDLPCVATPSEITFRPDDVVLLCVKGQDTEAALTDLRAAGMTDQPLFCLQNGTANERTALRYFPNVHGVTVMMPATYLEPGEVITHGAPCYGLFEIGRYPQGSDADDAALKEVLDKANIATFVSEAVMAAKYGKLLMNLGNTADAMLPVDDVVEALLVRQSNGDNAEVIGVQFSADLCRAFGEGDMQFGGLASCDCKARQIALHIRQKHRHPGIGKTLGKDLQRHRLARARRPRDQPVAVGIAKIEKLLGRMVGTAAADKDVTAHAGAFLSNLAIRPFH